VDSETWLDKATRLQRALARPAPGADLSDEENTARERIKLALWLRREFGDDGPAAEVIAFQSDQ